MSCKAIRSGDEMHCGPCGLQWSLGDPEPPECQHGKPPVQRHKSFGLRALHEMKQNLESDVVHKCSNCEFNEIQQCAYKHWGAGSGVNRDSLQVLMNVDNSKCPRWRLKR